MVAIIRRAQWGARFTIPAGRHVPLSARRWFVVHWPGSPVASDERAAVRAIETFHRQSLGWQAAPGYNFLVGRSGTIYEGCGRDVRGIHSPPRNTDGWGVCVLIAPGETPPQAALNATRALYNWLNGLVSGRTIGMTWHGQHHPTACAGPALNAWVQRGMPATPTPAPPPPPPPPPPWQPNPEDDPMILAFRNQFNGNTECFEINQAGDLFLRARGQQGNWTQARLLASGEFVGSPTHLTREDEIDVFCQRRNGGVIIYTWNASGGWRRRSLTQGIS